VLYNVFMKTLSVTDGRSKLGHWLKRAIAGDDIGIVVDGVVVGLRPIGVISEDYALREYGLTQDQADAAAARASKDIAAARKRGQVKSFTGKLNELRD
jgi:antitoxin (DNA-binding transcriptional repressor) of toxin-antitoxin stability system